MWYWQCYSPRVQRWEFHWVLQGFLIFWLRIIVDIQKHFQGLTPENPQDPLETILCKSSGIFPNGSSSVLCRLSNNRRPNKSLVKYFGTNSSIDFSSGKVNAWNQLEQLKGLGSSMKDHRREEKGMIRVDQLKSTKSTLQSTSHLEK